MHRVERLVFQWRRRPEVRRPVWLAATILWCVASYAYGPTELPASLLWGLIGFGMYARAHDA